MHWTSAELTAQQLADFEAGFRSGTTTVMAADANGWLVSVTPSGGWVPATIAGRTGIGLSQRMQSFVLDPAENPFNVVAPGKRPRVTLTPSLALKDGKPWLAFAVQGGDSQDQNLLQFFLNVQEFGMTPQEAAEAANFNSYQMKASFDQHESQPGRIVLNSAMPQWVTRELDRARLQARVRSPHVRPDQRDHDRPGERHVLGRLEQSRRGLRHRLVWPRVGSEPTGHVHGQRLSRMRMRRAADRRVGLPDALSVRAVSSWLLLAATWTPRLLMPIAVLQGLWVLQARPALPSPAGTCRPHWRSGLARSLRIIGVGDSIIAGTGRARPAAIR